jgi:CSLREA domain-containing protein
MSLVASAFVAGPAYAKTFTVDATADLSDPNLEDDACVVSIFGGCTLRAAIEQANATDGADTIEFNIPGSGPHTISPASALPFVSEALTIDGYSQPGASPNTNPNLAQGSNAAPKIELDGTGAGTFSSGLLIKSTAHDSAVRGLVINRFDGPGIVVEPGGKGNHIEGNFIGTDTDGDTDLGNSSSGVVIGGLETPPIGE